MRDIVVIGNICVDVYVPPHHAPEPGGIAYIPPLDLQVGGNGANTAIAARRFGADVALAGALGDDTFGDFLRRALELEGVDVSLLARVAGAHSPATLVQNDVHGERSFVHHSGTNAAADLLPARLVETPCRIFHLAAPELLPALWPERAVELAREFRARGVRVTLDTFVDPAAPPDEARRAHEEILRHVDVVLPNEDEARSITGEDDVDAMVDALHAKGPEVVAIKRGEKGAVVSWGRGRATVPADRVECVDTCGAGDSFVAGFLAASARGLDAVASAQLGCRLGTLCVQYRGALTGSADAARRERAVKGTQFVLKSASDGSAARRRAGAP